MGYANSSHSVYCANRVARPVLTPVLALRFYIMCLPRLRVGDIFPPREPVGMARPR